MVLMVQDINRQKTSSVVDPRLVGMIPEGIANAMAYYQLDSFVGGVKRKGIAYRCVFLSGEESSVLTLNMVRLTLKQACGFLQNVVLASCEAKSRRGLSILLM